MSMSTPGPDRVPSTVKVGKTSGQGKPPATGAKAAGSKAKGGAGGDRPGGAKGGGKGRKPITPVKVAGGTNWVPIAIGGLVGLVVIAIIGYSVFAVLRG